jgi:hypothetical protein
MKQHQKEITGRYQATGKGYGFLIPDDGGEDYFSFESVVPEVGEHVNLTIITGLFTYLGKDVHI